LSGAKRQRPPRDDKDGVTPTTEISEKERKTYCQPLKSITSEVNSGMGNQFNCQVICTQLHWQVELILAAQKTKTKTGIRI
jgi:hypothetical protein